MFPKNDNRQIRRCFRKTIIDRSDDTPLTGFPMRIEKLIPMNNAKVLWVKYNILHRPTHSLTEIFQILKSISVIFFFTFYYFFALFWSLIDISEIKLIVL